MDIFAPINTSSEYGEAFADSTYDKNKKYLPAKAVSGPKSYWCSKANPSSPVTFWFTFKQKQVVTKISFQDQYPIELDKSYEVRKLELFPNFFKNGVKIKCKRNNV